MIHLDKDLIARDQHFYLGFSGGIDSLGAALFLKKGGYNFTLLHVKHFENVASDDIMLGVVTLGDKLDLPYIIVSGADLADKSIAQLSYTTRPSEDSAYKIRKAVFHQLGKTVVTAHTLNDLAESYLQNCIKGSPSHTPLLAVSTGVIRPFLRTLRKDFEYIVEQHGYMNAVVPDSMHNQRKVLRESVFPALGTNLCGTVRRLFIDTGKIYTRV